MEIANIYFLVTSATLDSMIKQCSDGITDGEETQEQINYHRLNHSILALFYHAIKGTAEIFDFGGYYYLGLKNLRTDIAFGFLFF